MRISDWSSDVCSSDLSPKGAMGCMQIMPATWRYLTGRHGLGDDPWDARFNMIGGALYLAEMARRFGFPGAYAAYNAGPERYARHVRGAASLRSEEHTSELQSLMRISYAVFCLKKKKKKTSTH